MMDRLAGESECSLISITLDLGSWVKIDGTLRIGKYKYNIIIRCFLRLVDTSFLVGSWWHSITNWRELEELWPLTLISPRILNCTLSVLLLTSPSEVFWAVFGFWFHSIPSCCESKRSSFIQFDKNVASLPRRGGNGGFRKFRGNGDWWVWVN